MRQIYLQSFWFSYFQRRKKEVWVNYLARHCLLWLCIILFCSCEAFHFCKNRDVIWPRFFSLLGYMVVSSPVPMRPDTVLWTLSRVAPFQFLTTRCSGWFLSFTPSPHALSTSELRTRLAPPPPPRPKNGLIKDELQVFSSHSSHFLFVGLVFLWRNT